MKTEDLSVAGPGSPISMAKVVKHLDKTDTGKREMTVLIDGSGGGFELDDLDYQQWQRTFGTCYDNVTPKGIFRMRYN